ncbi:uncharacterized protein BJ171DRAFT_105506 [Polychytrium aggregatum]|uniref:uncharacterized protein n=1 Tax=Polychytrium aggregatum TaxID=110093 RepID=UPI0022FEA92D|nr:uncharacterized protein BJ171DRAFT_105506 [Polychytrium aggregatum]KAI9204355.1 hypothetical protein BJ171DRAFT_105506 [Polychytrium aggregatum]
MQLKEKLQGVVTTESVTRLLKSASNDTSSQDKIRFAQEILASRSIFIPAKQEWLCEWVCSAMIKSIPKDLAKVDGRRLDWSHPDPYVDADYWAFLLSLIKEFARLRKESLKSSGVDRTRAASIKVPILPLFTSLCAIVSSPKTEGAFLDTCNDLVRLAIECYALLTTELPDAFHLTIEQLVAFSSDILAAILVRTQPKSLHRDLSATLCVLLCRVLSTLTASCNQSSNQKKIFGLVCSKLLVPLLSILHQARWDHCFQEQCIAPIQSELETQIEDLIRTGLFHPEHIAEFSLTLQNLEAMAKLPKESKKDVLLSYPRQFFDQIKALAGADAGGANSTMALRSLPILLKLFLTSATQSSPAISASAVFRVEFSFFSHMIEIAIACVDRVCSEAHKSQNIDSQGASDSLAAAMFAVHALLEQLDRFEIYRPTNDDISRFQLKYFQGIRQSLGQYASQAPADVHSLFFLAWRQLLKIDFSIIFQNMDNIWPLALQPHTGCFEDAEEFVVELLDTFTKSRQLDQLIREVLGWIQQLHLHTDQRRFQTSTFFSPRVLGVLSACIRRNLPAQNVQIIGVFCEQLDECSGSIRDCLADQDEPAPKKVKKSDQLATGSVEGTKNIGCVEPLSLLLALVIKNTAISAGQQAAFSRLSGTLYEQFITPVLQSMPALESASTKRARDDPTLEFLYSALALHLNLMEASDQYWREHVRTNDILTLVKGLAVFIGREPRVAVLVCKIGLHHVDRIASTNTDLRDDQDCIDIVSRIMNSATQLIGSARHATWDRQWSQVSGSNIGVALWVTLLDHLAAICRVASQAQVEFIVKNVLLSLSMTNVAAHSGGSALSMASVTAQLLSSASFFELRPIRDFFLLGFWEQVSVLNTAVLPPVLLDFVRSPSHSQDPSRLQEAIVDPASWPAHSSAPVDILWNQISLLSLFPSLYFTAPEREALSWLCLALASFMKSRITSNTESQALRLIAVSLKLLVRYGKKDDRFITLQSPRLLQSIIELASSLPEGPEYNPICDQIRGAVLATVDQTSKKLPPKIGSKSVGRAATTTPADYVLEMIRYFTSSQARLPQAHGLWECSVVGFMTPLTQWVWNRHKRDTSHAGDQPAATIESEPVVAHVIESINGFIALIEDTAKRHLEQYANSTSVSRSVLDSAMGHLRLLSMAIRHYQRLALNTNDPHHQKIEQLYVYLVTLAAKVLADLQPTNAGNSDEGQLDFSAGILAELFHGIQVMSLGESGIDRSDKGADCAIDGLVALVQNVNSEQYQVLISWAIQKLELVSAARGLADPSTSRSETTVHIPSLGRIVEAMVSEINPNVSRRFLRQELGRIVVQLSRILMSADDVASLIAVLHLLNTLVCDRGLNMRNHDVATVLGAASTVTSEVALAHVSKITPEVAEKLFDGIYRLLLSLLRQRRDSVVELIPPFFSILKHILFCY